NLSKGQEYSLIWLQVALQDQNGFSYRKIYDFNELASILQQPQLPPAVQMSIALDIDISGSELILPPFEGTLQMIGVGFHESVIFSGLLNCQ
ncbi:MAG: hypothetical protein KDK51_03525, partial [Deltaproteobacteria bacterium]|nr:hypothetical protein [Deltaproteobacteria bacterium]